LSPLQQSHLVIYRAQKSQRDHSKIMSNKAAQHCSYYCKR